MDEQFHDSTQIPKDQLLPLLQRSDKPALRRFTIQYGLLLGSAAIVVAGPPLALPWGLIGAALGVFALMTMAMFAIVHETGHNTAFQSRALNRLVCVLAGTPIYYAPTSFREFHFDHHRYTQDPTRDPEISVAGQPAPSLTSNLGMYAAFLTGLPLMGLKVSILLAASLGAPPAVWTRFLVYILPRSRHRLIWQARAVLAFHILWVLAGVLWLPGLLYLLLGQVLGHMLLSAYLITEHTGLPYAGSILVRTRTTQAPGWLKWIMWNMSYHAEHHAYPAVPWHALPQLHRILAPELPHNAPSHGDFHRRAVGAFAQGRPFQEPGY